MPLFEGLALGSDKHSVVIEIGQAFTRCGFVHEYSPRAIIRSEVYSQPLNKVVKLMDVKDEDRLYFLLKDFIEILYFRYLAVNPKDRRVVVVESVFCPTSFRRTLAKVLFAQFDIPGLLLVAQHLTALMTLMIPSGLVVDVGYTECTVIPVIEGVTLLEAAQFAPLGGRAVHERIMKELIERKAKLKEGDGQEMDVPETEQLEEKVLEDIKARTCFVAPHERGQKLMRLRTGTDPDSGLADEVLTQAPTDVQFPIEGQKILTIPGTVRESACQVLFEMYGYEPNIPTLVLDALLKCPIDSRKMLAENLVIIGGTSMLPGFKNRLLRELQGLVQDVEPYKSSVHFSTFKVHQTPCRENYVSWLGASIFGSTDAITLRAISRDQFMGTNGSIIADWSDWWPSARKAA
jgi:actin-related protein 10